MTQTAEATETEDVESFRQRARAFLKAEMPRVAGERKVGYAAEEDDIIALGRDLQRRLWDGGLAGICWPRAYGGLGLTRAHLDAFLQEARDYELPLIFNTPTMTICLPTLLDCGTEEQKQLHVPAVLRGEELWVQFMSEPTGGSDLAGSLTRATRDGDLYLLNGSKIWSSGAFRADYAMCLARTNWDVPKHRGLTMFIVKIKSPGITVEQIRQVDGALEFCQEFFEEAPIPAANVVGTENDGWTIATRLLFHERDAVGGGSPYGYGRHVEGARARRGGGAGELVEMAKRRGRAGDDEVRRLVARAHVASSVHGHLVDRVATGIRNRYFPEPAGSLLRLYGGISSVERTRIAIELAGPGAAVRDGDDASEEYPAVGVANLMRQAGCIGGGTTEMARNIISERVLGMPREFAADKELPFSQVRRNTMPRRV